MLTGARVRVRVRGVKVLFYLRACGSEGGGAWGEGGWVEASFLFEGYLRAIFDCSCTPSDLIPALTPACALGRT